MTLYANGLRARHHISGKNTFRIRLSSFMGSDSETEVFELR
jgi:hypothetical protein